MIHDDIKDIYSLQVYIESSVFSVQHLPSGSIHMAPMGEELRYAQLARQPRPSTDFSYRMCKSGRSSLLWRRELLTPYWLCRHSTRAETAAHPSRRKPRPRPGGPATDCNRRENRETRPRPQLSPAI